MSQRWNAETAFTYDEALMTMLICGHRSRNAETQRKMQIGDASKQGRDMFIGTDACMQRSCQ